METNFYIPTQHPEDWQKLLAEPEKQWRVGYSARTLAYCWETADGFPPEVRRIFAESGVDDFAEIEPLAAFVEHQVPMPGKGKPSQNDLFVLAKAHCRLVSITVEGKVAEPFGNTLFEWNDGSPNKAERLKGILGLLGLPPDIPAGLRYQLLHRMASAVIEARRFEATSAVMLVHSFSPDHLWFADYQAFLDLYGVQGAIDKLVSLRCVEGIDLYAGWVHGDAQFLTR